MARLADSAARFALFLLRFAGAGLVAFHLWLIVDMAADGRLADPIVAFRWLVAVGLAGGLVALRRAGIPIVRSRQGAALWVLVVLLHASAAGSMPGQVPGDPGDMALLFVVPAAPAALAVAVGVLVVCGRRLAATVPPALLTLWRIEGRRALAARASCDGLLVPRAPPASALSSC
jgi:hypothetical protein